MRQLVVGLAIMLVSLGWGRRSFGQEVPSPRGELRIVDKSPVNWISMTFNVFEHLVEADPQGQMVPRLATDWRWIDDRTEEVLGTVDRERQQQAIRQMERLRHDQAYFLFLYNPIQLFAVNKAVVFVPYVSTLLKLAETGVMAQHWSVQQGSRKE
jgi:ABC-type transport system substrate-binding protein